MIPMAPSQARTYLINIVIFLIKPRLYKEEPKFYIYVIIFTKQDVFLCYTIEDNKRFVDILPPQLPVN